MNILVCGFMGSGKTTFVEGFCDNQLGYEVVDLDSAVASELGILPGELGDWIRKHGIASFRDKEIFVLNNLLSTPTSKIIALGGGTVEAPGFPELASKSRTVFLNVAFETCFARIKNDPNRPLAGLGIDGLRELYQRRLPVYSSSDLCLSETEIKGIVSLSSLVHNLSSVFKPTRG